MDYEQLPRAALVRMLQEHDAALADAGKNGIVMSYTGRAAPWQIIRQVKPKLHRIIKKVSFGEETAQSENEIWDGENLSAMVTLYKYRGQVDLVVTDPPYNTGEDFRYNDKWDKDPNDPDLGDVVPKDDGSKHSPALTPRRFQRDRRARAEWRRCDKTGPGRPRRDQQDSQRRRR